MIQTAQQALSNYLNVLQTQALITPEVSGLSLLVVATGIFGLVFWSLLLLSFSFCTRLKGWIPDHLPKHKKWEVAWCMAHVPFHFSMLFLSNFWLVRQWQNGYWHQGRLDYGYRANDEILLRNTEYIFIIILSGMLTGDVVYRFVFRIKDVLMIVHHLYFFFGAFVPLTYGIGSEITLLIGVSETTGVFLDISQIMDRTEFASKFPRVHLVNNILLLFFFFTHRLALFIYVVFRYLPFHPLFIRIPALYWVSLIGMLLAIGMNGFWFYKIISVKFKTRKLPGSYDRTNRAKQSKDE